MGAGKSTVGPLAGQLTGTHFLDLDQVIEQATGRSIVDIFSEDGEEAFRALERQYFNEVFMDVVLGLGGGAPMQDDIWRRVKAEATSVFLDAPFDVLWRRLGGGSGRPLAAGRDRSELEALLAARRPRYLEADHTVDAARSPEIVADEVVVLWSA